MKRVKEYLKTGYIIHDQGKLIESTASLQELVEFCRVHNIDMRGTTSYRHPSGVLYTDRNWMCELEVKNERGSGIKANSIQKRW